MGEWYVVGGFDRLPEENSPALRLLQNCVTDRLQTREHLCRPWESAPSWLCLPAQVHRDTPIEQGGFGGNLSGSGKRLIQRSLHHC